MFGRRRPPRNCNFVHDDEIWKTHVERERETTKKWPGQWGFMLPAIGKPSTRSEAVSTKLKPRGNLSNFKLPPIAGVKVRQPLTTTGLIGWRTNDIALERYGRHARGIAKIESPLSILHRI